MQFLQLSSCRRAVLIVHLHIYNRLTLCQALERTFLSYIRTSNALASLSVAIYQLSRLSSPSSTSQSGSSPPSPPRILRLEKAATLLMMAGALLITLVGCGRFLVGQKKVEKGRCRIGGFEMGGVGAWLSVVSIAFLSCTSCDKRKRMRVH